MPPESSPPSFSARHKWTVVANVAASVLALLAIVVMANYIAARHDKRLYVAQSSIPTLSPATLRVLGSVTNSIKVIVFFDRREPLFNAVSLLVKEYQARCPKLDIEFVDYHFPGRAAAIRNEYQLTSPSEGSRVIFDCAGRVRSVLATELSDYDFSAKKEIRRSAFKGEQLFTSALLSVTESRQLKAYLLGGHKEHDPHSSDDSNGYTKFARMLQDNNIETWTLPTLVGTNSVPADCQLLVIAGPLTSFTSDELDKIDRYLKEGGRLFALFNVFDHRVGRTGLEKLLLNWNVEVGDNWVKDRAQARPGEANELITSEFGPHSVVKPLLRSRLHMVLPRFVGQRSPASQSADAPKVVELVFTSNEAVAVNANGTADRTGRMPLMVAVEKGGIQGMSADRGATRIVVAGNSLFLANGLFESAANRDFANLAVNWLLNRDLLLGDISPRPVKEYQISVTDSQARRLSWVFLALLPGAVVVVGAIVWFRRRT